MYNQYIVIYMSSALVTSSEPCSVHYHHNTSSVLECRLLYNQNSSIGEHYLVRILLYKVVSGYYHAVMIRKPIKSFIQGAWLSRISHKVILHRPSYHNGSTVCMASTRQLILLSGLPSNYVKCMWKLYNICTYSFI